MKVVAYTLMHDRLFYTKRMVGSLQASQPDWDYHHIFIDQDSKDGSADWIESLEDHRYEVVKFHLNTGLSYGTRHGIWRALELGADVVVCIENDVVVHSRQIWTHMEAVLKLTGMNVWLSPYVMGTRLDTEAIGRHCAYSEDTDWYYTLRRVRHLAGRFRVMPREVLSDIRMPYGNEDHCQEDLVFSRQLMDKDIPIYIVENGVVVEHQEGAKGQKLRNPEYYKADYIL